MLSQKWWFILFFFIFAPLLLVKIILMKRNVTFLRALITSSLIFISFLSFSQSVDNEVIMNLGFERWVSDGPFKGEPEHWHGISSASGTYKGLLTKPQMEMSRITRPGSEGNYSVRLFPRSIFGVVVNDLRCLYRFFHALVIVCVAKTHGLFQRVAGRGVSLSGKDCLRQLVHINCVGL